MKCEVPSEVLEIRPKGYRKHKLCEQVGRLPKSFTALHQGPFFNFMGDFLQPVIKKRGEPSCVTDNPGCCASAHGV